MGNVNDKLAYIAGTKTDIRDAIIAKGVAVPAETTFREYATKVGLIAGFVPNFNPTDGKTYLFITLTSPYLSPTLYIRKSTTDLLTVTWGDGSSSTSSASGNINLSKTYSVAGYYTISIQCSGAYSLGNGSNNYSVFAGNANYRTILKQIQMGTNVTLINYDFQKTNGLEVISLPLSVTAVGNNTFESCLLLKTVILTTSITAIGNYAFISCSSLSSIELPDSVTTIGESAFQSCAGLKYIAIPSSTTSIGQTAFMSSGLKSVIIPSSVTSIGVWAFYDCSNLSDVVIYKTVPPTLGAQGFGEINANLKIYVPDASVSAYKAATNWSAYASYIFPISIHP